MIKSHKFWYSDEMTKTLRAYLFIKWDLCHLWSRETKKIILATTAQHPSFVFRVAQAFNMHVISQIKVQRNTMLFYTLTIHNTAQKLRRSKRVWWKEAVTRGWDYKSLWKTDRRANAALLSVCSPTISKTHRDWQRGFRLYKAGNNYY